MPALIVLILALILSSWACGYSMGHWVVQGTGVPLDRPHEIAVVTGFIALITGAGLVMVAVTELAAGVH